MNTTPPAGQRAASGSYGRAVAAVIAAAVAFGTTGTAQAKGPAGTTPLGVGAVRIAIGAAGLLVATLVTARRRRSASSPDAGAATSGAAAAGAVLVGRATGGLWPCGAHLWAALVGGAGVALYQPAFFAGTQRNGVAVGTIVALGSGPVFVGLWEALWQRRRPSARWTGVTALALCGGALLVAVQSGTRDGAATITVFGVLCSLGAGFGYAVYALAGKRLIDEGVDSGLAMTWVFVAGALLLSPALVAEPLGWLASGRGVAMALHLGLVTVTLGYLLYGYGLRTLAASTAVTLTLAEPMTAALSGVVVLGERLPVLGWCGAALVAIALLLTGRGESVPTVPEA